MRLFKNALALLVLVITFSSCQKEASQEIITPIVTANPASALPKKYIEDITSSGQHTSTTYNLTYDGSGRVTSIIDSAVSGNKLIFQYTNSTSYTLDIYEANVVTIHETFFLNSLSLVDSSFQFNDTKDTTTEKYTYNSNKQLITFREYDYSRATGAVLDNTHKYTYDSNGNQTKEEDNSGVLTYDYYTNLENNLSLGFIYYFANKNLVKTSTYTSGSLTVSAVHAYIFDTEKRLSSEKITSGEGGVAIKTYIYK